MTTTPRPPQGRAQQMTRLLIASMLPSVLAVLAVAAVITALYVWQRNSTSEAAPAKSSTTKAALLASDPASPAPSLTSPPPSPVATSASPTSSTAAPTPSPVPSKTAKNQPRLTLVVFNATRRTGLARSVAARLKANGWTVVQLGNLRNGATSTTIYYPAAAQAQAKAVAADLPNRVRTRLVTGGLSRVRLTVVVADDYPR